MSMSYFTGSNAATNTAATKDSRHTAMTYYWFPETEPVNNADGIDAKGQGKGSKWDRIKSKIHSTTAIRQKGGKARGAACIGKYNLGRMIKYRKTLKKLHTAAGHAVGAAKGERNMFTTKGNGNTGNTARPKNAQSLPLADSYELFPIDAGK